MITFSLAVTKFDKDGDKIRKAWPSYLKDHIVPNHPIRALCSQGAHTILKTFIFAKAYSQGMIR